MDIDAEGGVDFCLIVDTVAYEVGEFFVSFRAVARSYDDISLASVPFFRIGTVRKQQRQNND